MNDLDPQRPPGLSDEEWASIQAMRHRRAEMDHLADRIGQANDRYARQRHSDRRDEVREDLDYLARRTGQETGKQVYRAIHGDPPSCVAWLAIFGSLGLFAGLILLICAWVTGNLP